MSCVYEARKTNNFSVGRITVVIHNVALIQKFREKENVNWIELSDGYLEAVDRFSRA